MSIKILNAKPFPEHFYRAINSHLQTLATNSKPTAVFDADGTLWKTDVGENFFDFIIEQNLVNLPNDPWSHYLNLPKPEAYLWLAQIFRGLSVAEVRKIALNFKEMSEPVPVFSPVQELISYFQSQSVEIYIVTASVKWAVEPYAADLQIPEDHVLGIETETDHTGCLGMGSKGAISWREGKLKKFQETVGVEAPDFAFGNTLGDRWLIENALGFSACFRSEQPGSRVFDEEQALFDWAAEQNWNAHAFD